MPKLLSISPAFIDDVSKWPINALNAHIALLLTLHSIFAIRLAVVQRLLRKVLPLTLAYAENNINRCVHSPKFGLY